MKNPSLIVIALLISVSSHAFCLFSCRVWTVATSAATRELNVNYYIAYSPSPGDSITINWDDGSSDTIAMVDYVRRDSLPFGSSVYYKVSHTYSPGTYQISVLGGVHYQNLLNMQGAGVQPAYFMAVTTIDPNIGANSSPWSDSLELFCNWNTSQMNSVTFEVNDPDGDSLAWYTVSPGPNYYYPSTVGGGNFVYSSTAPMNCNWNPNIPGCYNVLFLIEEWRNINNTMVMIGYGMREMFFNVDNAIGVPEYAVAKMFFYPNPASEEIRFDQPVEEVSIANYQGAVVLSAHYTSAVNVSGLAQGTYIVTVNGTISRRMVIVR